MAAGSVNKGLIGEDDDGSEGGGGDPPCRCGHPDSWRAAMEAQLRELRDELDAVRHAHAEHASHVAMILRSIGTVAQSA